MKSDEKKGLEEHFLSIEEILKMMENPDITLEQSFSMYQKGMEELKEANAMLDEIEKAMLVMTEQGELEEFE